MDLECVFLSSVILENNLRRQRAEKGLILHPCAQKEETRGPKLPGEK